MRYSGKRLLPTLCIAACELVGGHEAQAMPVACAVEMIHTMSLIHHDLPSLNNKGFRLGKPRYYEVFGEETVVLAADAFVSLSFEHIAAKTTKVASAQIVCAVAELSSAVGSKGLIAGHILDLITERKQVKLSELEYTHMHKTSKQLEAAAVCGATVGRGDAAAVETIRSYSRCLGLLLHVEDDIHNGSRLELIELMDDLGTRLHTQS